MTQVYVRKENGVVVGWFSSPQEGFTTPMDIDDPEITTPQPTPVLVDDERDRRISSGFVFSGILYQSGPEDRENIMGASTAALAAIVAGAAEGDYRWADPSADFVWIDEANDSHPMDAQTMFAFGKTALAHKQAHIFAGRAIKDMSPIPVDYQDDKYWP